MIEMLRQLGRWLMLLAILFVIVPVLISDVLPPLKTPPVKMPSGDVTDTGVSNALNMEFRGITGSERLHFVVQFRRELSQLEAENIGRRHGIQLDGPVPENAYMTSASASEWPTVRDALLAESPRAVSIFGFKPQDKLSSELGDAAAPTIPGYASPTVDTVALFVTFFDDVPVDEQRDVLRDYDASQPGRRVVRIDPTGVWAITIPSVFLSDLLTRDPVRFVEPTTREVVDDMDQARPEVDAAPLAVDGTGVLIAQWEQCQVSTLHQDMSGRATPIGSIYWLCRKWRYLDKTDDDNYDVGEPIEVDLDEDGTHDLELYPGFGLPNEVDAPQWKELPLHLDNTGHLFVKQTGGDPTQIEIGDTKLTLSNSAPFVDPASVTVVPADPAIRSYVLGSHPTRVAGIMISNSTSVITGGNPKYPGMAPAGAVRSYAWNHFSTTNEYPDAIAHGARISSNSFGFQGDYHFVPGAKPYYRTSQFYDEVTSGRRLFGTPSFLAARMLVVGSSGNLGDPSDPDNTANAFWRTARIINSAKNVVAVGNISSSKAGNAPESLGIPAHDSGRGPTLDGRLTPILSAPGDQLECISVGLGKICNPNADAGVTSTIPVDDYHGARGTSFSTPIVSGAAALVSQVYKNECTVAALPQDLRALLVHSAKDLTRAPNLAEIPLGTNLEGPDFVFGYGLVQTAKAAALVDHTVNDTIQTGWVEHRVDLSNTDQLVDTGGGYQLRVTLVWDDPPYYRQFPPRDLTGMLQNDIDLEVIDPTGTRHLPWILDASPGKEATPAIRESRKKWMYIPQELRDHRNTIEQVVVDVPPSLIGTTWKVRVRGFRIRRGPQEYTLVSKLFRQLPSTDCGDFSNGTTVKIADPYELPDTRWAWILFWVAVIILIWLTWETILWLIQSTWGQYGIVTALLMALFVLLLLFAVFRLLFLQEFLWLAKLVLLLLIYVLWRATR